MNLRCHAKATEIARFSVVAKEKERESQMQEKQLLVLNDFFVRLTVSASGSLITGLMLHGIQGALIGLLVGTVYGILNWFIYHQLRRNEWWTKLLTNVISRHLVTHVKADEG